MRLSLCITSDIIPGCARGWLALGIVLALVLRQGNPGEVWVLARMVKAGID